MLTFSNDKRISHKRILIVDDEPLISEIVEMSLKQVDPDCQVVIADDGFAALKQLQQHPFDLLITDYSMPGMTGLDLAQAVREIWPRMQIVLMTGDPNVATTFHARIKSLNLNGLLDKPFGAKKILEIFGSQSQQF